MTLAEAMRRHRNARPTENDAELAASFVAGRTKAELIPLIEEEFIHMRRGSTQATERAALLAGRNGNGRAGRAVGEASRSDALEDLRRLLDEPYRVGNGTGEKLARDMTLEDWKTRRQLLEAQRRGYDQAIEACDRAIELIERAGVNSLGEVEAASAV